MRSTTQLWELRDCEILGMHTLRGVVLESRVVLDALAWIGTDNNARRTVHLL